MKLLKRYANRRLYDPETSKTITLEDVAEMVIAGDDIKVIDNITGQDITPKILGQTFLKVSFGQRNAEFSNFMLSALIRETGKDISSFFGRLVVSGIGEGSLTKEKIEKILQNMVELGELKLTELKDYRDDLLRNFASKANEKKQQIKLDLDKISETLKEEKGKSLEKLSEKLREVANMIKEIN
ncbi:MAG: polyhydroxyalkanoate biosynthesis repressor PhaR [Leptospira sp.]|nr:polyhydroxyalkanoate biosynthesis repressor PhaR [Leptospira sp.]